VWEAAPASAASAAQAWEAHHTKPRHPCSWRTSHLASRCCNLPTDRSLAYCRKPRNRPRLPSPAPPRAHTSEVYATTTRRPRWGTRNRLEAHTQYSRSWAAARLQSEPGDPENPALLPRFPRHYQHRIEAGNRRSSGGPHHRSYAYRNCFLQSRTNRASCPRNQLHSVCSRASCPSSESGSSNRELSTHPVCPHCCQGMTPTGQPSHHGWL